jgi:hypothetical protein
MNEENPQHVISMWKVIRKILRQTPVIIHYADPDGNNRWCEADCLERHIARGEGPVPLLVQGVVPVTVQDQLHELHPRRKK